MNFTQFKTLFCALICMMLLTFSAQAQFSNAEYGQPVKTQDIQGTAQLKIFTSQEPLDRAVTYTLTKDGSDVADLHDYAGLAVYLGDALPVGVTSEGVVKVLKPDAENPTVEDIEWVGYKGRFQFVLIRAEEGEVSLNEDAFSIRWQAGNNLIMDHLSGMQDSPEGPANAKIFDIRHLKYAHLPRWLRVICRAVEVVFTTIQSVTTLPWGVALVIFAIVMKLLLLPVAILTAKFQEQVNGHKAALEPILADIKRTSKGEAAHNKTMAAYKARGITPYYVLKPFLATAIGLPILIAIFNMLGEVQPLDGSGFLWINSLAHPDQLFPLPVSIPFFGNTFNLLPFLMTAVTIYSTLTLKSDLASPADLKRQKRNLYFMAAAFFVLFYPFPSAMVLYWTLATLLQLPLNYLMKRRA